MKEHSVQDLRVWPRGSWGEAREKLVSPRGLPRVDKEVTAEWSHQAGFLEEEGRQVEPDRPVLQPKVALRRGGRSVSPGRSSVFLGSWACVGCSRERVPLLYPGAYLWTFKAGPQSSDRDTKAPGGEGGPRLSADGGLTPGGSGTPPGGEGERMSFLGLSSKAKNWVKPVLGAANREGLTWHVAEPRFILSTS